MTAFIIELIVSILKAFVPAIGEASKDTYTIAVEESEGLEKRLRASVKATWGALLISCLLLTGCFERTVYIPDGTPVKLRETVKSVKIWVKTKDGQTIATEMDLQEGWFVLPDKKK